MRSAFVALLVLVKEKATPGAKNSKRKKKIRFVNERCLYACKMQSWVVINEPSTKTDWDRGLNMIHNTHDEHQSLIGLKGKTV